MADPEYNEFMEEAEHIIRSKGFDVSVEEINDDEHLVICIMKDDTEIGSLSIVKTNDSGIYDRSKTGSLTRHKNDTMNNINNEIFSISWLGISDEYTGRGLGILLLIYGICFIKNRFNHVIYVKLDDDSEKANSIESNIYNRIGFSYIVHSSLDITASTQVKGNKLSPHGPEKQLLLQDPDVKSRIRRVLYEISHKGGKKTKNRKTKNRKTKNRKTKNRKTKNKKTKRKY